MLMVYVYVLDTLADWELGQVLAELSSGRFFKKDAPRLSLKTVGCSKEPVRTMGGLTILPDLSLDDIAAEGAAMLLLPGTAPSSKRRASFSPPARRWPRSAAPPLRWPTSACWTAAPTPATGPGFWTRSAPAMRDKNITSTRPRRRTAA